MSVKYIILLPIIFCSNYSVAECHPQIDSNKKNYVFGYGSLINESSKRYTVDNVGENFPVTIKDYKRGWYHRIYNNIYLGIINDSKSQINGVIFEIFNPDDIKDFDSREIGYCRELISNKKINSLSSKKIDGNVWIYVTQNPISLNNYQKDDAIDLSYIYTFLSGCLNIEKKFKLENFLSSCIINTHDWVNSVNYDVHPNENLRKRKIIPKDNDLKIIHKEFCKEINYHDNKYSDYQEICKN